MSFVKFTYDGKWFDDGIPPANRTVKWQEPNSKTKRMYPDMSDTFDYNLNNLGYRDVDWTEKDKNDSIWCIGHSDVAGIGVRNEDTWVRVLENLIGIKTLNLGINGAAWDTFSRIVCSGLKSYKPKAIVIQSTTLERREFVTNDIKRILLPSMPKRYFPHRYYWKFIDDESNQYSLEKNINLIELACQASKVPLLIFSMEDRWGMIAKDPAIDNVHIGKNTHRSIAEYLDQELKKLL